MSSLGSRKESRPPVMVPPMALQEETGIKQGWFSSEKSLRQKRSVPLLLCVSHTVMSDSLRGLGLESPGSALRGISQGTLLGGCHSLP